MSQQLTAQRMDLEAAKALDKELFYQRAMKLWLQGYSIDHIRRVEGLIEAAPVIQAVNIKRKEIKEAQEADLLDLAAERIAGLKMVKTEARDFAALYPSKASQFLSVMLRAEEIQAKIEGVLSEKVLHLGRIQHEIKLYDFVDNTPPMAGSFITPPDSVTLAEKPLAVLPIPTIVEFSKDQREVVTAQVVVEAITKEIPAMTVVTHWGD